MQWWRWLKRATGQCGWARMDTDSGGFGERSARTSPRKTVFPATAFVHCTKASMACFGLEHSTVEQRAFGMDVSCPSVPRPGFRATLSDAFLKMQTERA